MRVTQGAVFSQRARPAPPMLLWSPWRFRRSRSPRRRRSGRRGHRSLNPGKIGSAFGTNRRIGYVHLAAMGAFDSVFRQFRSALYTFLRNGGIHHAAFRARFGLGCRRRSKAHFDLPLQAFGRCSTAPLARSARVFITRKAITRTESYGMSSVVLRSRSAIFAASSSMGPYSMALARQ